MPTASPSSSPNVRGRCWKPRASERVRRPTSAPSCRRARSPTSSMDSMPVSDLAHLGPVEMFTPKGEESLRFFTDVMGMVVEHQEGHSTYLRGWGDYQPWSLKLTESHTSGMGVLGLRAWSPEALQRRGGPPPAAGGGGGGGAGAPGPGPPRRLPGPPRPEGAACPARA